MTGSPSPAPPPALAATDLVAGYRARRRTTPVVTVDRVVADRGALTAVVGPNGAGKSTLLRTLVGSQPPLAGTVEVDGRRLDRLDPRTRARHLAVVLTDRVDPGRLTVGEVVALGRHPHTGWSGRMGRDDVAAARRAADLVGIGDLWARPFAELSDGQRQRALVARALAQDPALVVLDEPTAFLDLPGRAALTLMLRDLARGAGVATVVSTHDLDLALGHADRLWVVDGGAVTVGAPEDLLADGTLAQAFAADGMTLDPTSGLLRAAPPARPAVAVTGPASTRALAARTAQRCGVRVVEEVGAPGAAATSDGVTVIGDAVDVWSLAAGDGGWTLRCGAHVHRGATYDELARTLRAHVDRTDGGQVTGEHSTMETV